MKRLMIILVLASVILPTTTTAQNIDLTKLPAAKRDSVAIDIAVAAMKQYAPSYYKEGLPIKVFEDRIGFADDKDYGKIRYTVCFIFDLRKAIEDGREGENIYGGDVYIFGETGRVMMLLPRGWERFLMINQATTRSGEQEIAPPMTVPRSQWKR